MIIDSTVFIDVVRGNEQAHQFLLNTDETMLTSSVVVMEIVTGFKTKREIPIFHKQLSSLHIAIVNINETISLTALSLFERYYHGRGLGIMDALIAATALYMNEMLATHNTKHFVYIDNLNLVRPY